MSRSGLAITTIWRLVRLDIQTVWSKRQRVVLGRGSVSERVVKSPRGSMHLSNSSPLLRTGELGNQSCFLALRKTSCDEMDQYAFKEGLGSPLLLH